MKASITRMAGLVDNVMDLFQRGGQGQGLGLGLYISSEIARAHGGSLSVASDNNATRFTFSIPAR